MKRSPLRSTDIAFAADGFGDQSAAGTRHIKRVDETAPSPFLERRSSAQAMAWPSAVAILGWSIRDKAVRPTAGEDVWRPKMMVT